MLNSFKSPSRNAWIRTLFGVACAGGAAAAQDFSLQVTDTNPLRINSFVPSRLDLAADAGVEGGIKGAFAYGLGLKSTYDSNFELTDSDESSEVYIQFAPWLNYISDPEGGAAYSLTANYTPTYLMYLDNDGLSDLNNAADFTLSFVGSKTNISLFARYNDVSGTDRLTGGYTTGWIITGGAQATRQVAPRTFINGELTYSQSDFSGGETTGSQVLTGSFGGIWNATERTGIGASIRYTRSESDNTGTRDAWALLAEARYKASERVWLSASLGPEFASDSESGDNTVGVKADIQARYIINERWSWVNSINTATVPSPSDAGYVVNNVFVTSGLEHQLLRALIRGGVEFNYSDYQSVGDTLLAHEDEKNIGFFLTYGRNFFSERVAFDASLRYRVNSGDRDWSQWLLSTGLNVPF